MATVSLSGVEYQELIIKADQWNKFMDYVLAGNRVTLGDPDSYYGYSFPERAIAPDFIRDAMIANLVKQIEDATEEEQQSWLKNQLRYYHPDSHTLERDTWRNRDAIDLLERSTKLKALWYEHEAKLKEEAGDCEVNDV